jgi:hypothetical protein
MEPRLIERLLRHVSATETEEISCSDCFELLSTGVELDLAGAIGARPRAGRRAWPPEGPLGYTGSYVELKNSGIETEPFVANLLARGP